MMRKSKQVCRNAPYLMSTSLPVGSLPSEMARSEKLIAADELAERRHENVADQRGDDLAERGADDHTDRQIDHVAFHGKFFEF